MKAELDPRFEREAFPRLDLIPFESEHRFMATLHHDHEGHAFVYLKGAPEKILEMCQRERRQDGDHPLDIDGWYQRIEAIASRRQRPLAVAFKALPGDQHLLQFEDVEEGLTLLGLLGLMDPPREEAILAVRQCQEAGIWVKMITGDHALTARAIGQSLGIGDGAGALTGTELDAIPDADLRAAALGVKVFARATPEHKLRLVQALQAEGEIVAMTGDGVNDAPALKRADIGIAMGIKGTEVAKEATEMVLANDNFASIAHAVEEGRTVYDNLKKAIVFILPTNGGEAFALIAAILFGLTLPITPVQILWVNMITTVTLALALGFESPESAVMRRPPRDPAEPLLSGFLVWRIVFVSLIIVTGTLGLFLWDLAQGVSVDYARTVAVNTLVMYEAFYLLNTCYITVSVLSREGLLGNRYVLLAIEPIVGFQLLFTYASPMQHLFSTKALEAREWGRIFLVGATVLVLVELEKGVLAWRVHRRNLERLERLQA